MLFSQMYLPTRNIGFPKKLTNTFESFGAHGLTL